VAVKSVIDVEINDERFKKFAELYNKFHAQVDKLPNAWGKVGDKQSEVGKGLEHMTAALLAQLELSRKSDDEDEKRVKRLETSEKLWTSIQTSALSTSKSVLEIGRGILGFGALALGAAAGGIYALDRLGHAAGDARRSSSGLGLSIGQQKAFGNSFSRFVDPDSFLGGISAAQSDLSKQGSLYGIGVNPNQDVASLALDTLKHVRQLAQATPLDQLGILESSRHLDQLGLGVEDLRRLRKTGDSEFDRQMSTYRSGIAAQGINDSTAERWQNFTQTLERAGTQIENLFVNKLANLTEPVGKLTDSFVHLVERVADNGQITKGIDTFAAWINSLSGDIAKPEFLTSIDTFTTDLVKLAESVHSVVGFFQNPSDEQIDQISAGQTDRWNAIKRFFGFDTNPKEIDPFANRQRMLAAAKSEGSSFALGMAEFGNESSFGSDPKAYDPYRAHKGIFQIGSEWANKFHLDPLDPQQAPLLDAKINAYLERKYHDIGKALAAYNMGETDFDAATHGGKDANWRSEIPASAQAYVDKGMKVIVQLNLPPGGSVLTAAQQIAPN
jgi:hypothetical protein